MSDSDLPLYDWIVSLEQFEGDEEDNGYNPFEQWGSLPLIDSEMLMWGDGVFGGSDFDVNNNPRTVGRDLLEVVDTDRPAVPYFEWTPEVEARGRRNVQRSQEWLRAHEELCYWKDKIEKIERDTRHKAQQAALFFKPSKVWPRLSASQQWKKETLLRCLQSPCRIAGGGTRIEGEGLPTPLIEKNWHSHVPTHIRLDPDLFKARMVRPGFALAYRSSPLLKLHLPREVLPDKEVVLQLLQIYPECLYEASLSEELLADEDVFVAALKIPRTFHTESHEAFLQKFAGVLRANYNLIVQHACETMPFHLIVRVAAKRLHDNGKFLLNLLEKVETVPDDALSAASDRLRDTHRIVAEYVRYNGHNLRYASKRLRGHMQTVRIACRSTPIVLLESPREVREILRKDLAFMVKMITDSKSNPDLVWRLWCLCPQELKGSQDVVLAAMASPRIRRELKQCMLRSPIIHEVRCSVSFWNDAISMHDIKWNDLPYKMRDARIAKLLLTRIKDWSDIDMVHTLMEEFHDTPLLDDREVVMAIARSLDAEEAIEYWLKSPFIDDREIAMELAKRCKGVLMYLKNTHSPLMNDIELLTQCMKIDPLAVSHLSMETQLSQPDLIVTAIEHTPSHQLFTLFEELDEGVWQHADTVKAWIKQGGDFLDEFPIDFLESEELFLLVAKHHPVDFYCASEKLTSNKEFMSLGVCIERASV
jgi:hypothetical protein